MNEKEITDFAAWAMGLGSAPFTVLVVIAVGYVFRLIPAFPNKWIPFFCILVGAILFPCLAHRHSDDTSLNYYTRTVFMGMIIGLGAVGLHERFIARFEDRFPLLGKLLSAIDDGNNSNKTTTGSKP